MTLILHLLSLAALAQEPQQFPPIPVDYTTPEGAVLAGILVDEATYAELGALRVTTKAQAQDLRSFEEWRVSQTALVNKTILAMQEEAHAGQQRLSDHYEAALQREARKDVLQRHGFTLGVALGVVSTAALTVAVLQVYDRGLPASLR